MKNSIKKMFFVYLFFLLILFLFTITYAILIYFDKVSSNITKFNTTTFIIGIILFLILGIISGNVAQKNGFVEGLVSSLILLLIVLLVNWFIRVSFDFRTFVKYVTYLTASSLGGIIGVNFKPIFHKSSH